MKTLVVDIAGMQVSGDPEVTLITYALGSCIAVAAYDPGLRVGGMIHYMLPMTSTAPDHAEQRPLMFGDSAIPMLFESIYRLGSKKSDLLVYVAGGAHIQDTEKVFNIGKRNYTVLRKMFWKNNVIISAEHVGGGFSRNFTLELSTGRVAVRIQGEETSLSGSQSRARVDAFQGGEP